MKKISDWIHKEMNTRQAIIGWSISFFVWSLFTVSIFIGLKNGHEIKLSAGVLFALIFYLLLGVLNLSAIFLLIHMEKIAKNMKKTLNK